MANQEHLQKLKEGSEAWNHWREKNSKQDPLKESANGPNYGGGDLLSADLSEADLNRIDLSKADLNAAHLKGANLSEATLRKLHWAFLIDANLHKAWLVDADLSKANLTRAKLGGATLQRANLVGAELSNADLGGADLSWAKLNEAYLEEANLNGANLIGANLTGAKLTGADLSGAHLSGTNLTDADLTDVKGLVLDNSRIVHARFSPRAKDEWSVLRRTYTGPNLVLNLLFLMLFFAPLVVKGAGLSALGNAQQRVIETANRIEGYQLRIACDEPNGAISGTVRGGEVRVPCRSEPMWRLLLGFGGPYGIFMPVLTGILIGYQILRYLLTRQISLVRDAEERSGISPPRTGVFAYPRLYRIHQLLRVIFLIAAATFVLRAIEFLFLSDVIFVGRGH
jgi:Pentapeptide repeats (8 copies)